MKNNAPRVLQLIDSLAAGGAERVSVNLANALSEAGVASFLCATRAGGTLEGFIDNRVETLLLHKRSALDAAALYRLVTFIRRHKINIVHAHSSSFFTAVLCKPFTGVKIVWHDHYGDAEQLSERNSGTLKRMSAFFDYVLSVNDALAAWSKTQLKVPEENVLFLHNFAKLSPTGKTPELPGDEAHRIVCLANLRPQKDHMTLLRAFEAILADHPEWHLLMVGEDKQDAYSDRLKSYIENQGMGTNAHILGARGDAADILAVSTVGVLSSKSEGLPVALLEYGLTGLPVVCTDVGQCGDVLDGGNCGLLVAPEADEAFANALRILMDDTGGRNRFSADFADRIRSNYSKTAVIEKLLNIYKGLLSV